VGYGECGLLKGLSYDDVPDYEDKLSWACNHIHLGLESLWSDLLHFPSIQFGLEQAFLSLQSSHPFMLFPSPFISAQTPIPINGLIWMGDQNFMSQQIGAILNNGFNCVKMKIGAIDVDQELTLLRSIRQQYPEEVIELRVDANGAFDLKTAYKVMESLQEIGVHSIEQPLPVQSISDLATLCADAPIPVALDESLIGCLTIAQKEHLLDTVNPQYIILKPSFIGGFKGSDQWIQLANSRGIGWWVTSALESNIGLNAIAQWVFLKNTILPQGLGTGSLYTNNIPAPLKVQKGTLAYDSKALWNTKIIDDLCM
jgi:o-succinylbenzoate synthase